MFCPKCRAEYRTGFTRCSDCKVALVDHLAPEEPEPDRERQGSAPTTGAGDTVEIARFMGIHQADFARSALESNGIEAWLDQPFLANIAPHYMLATGGLRLFVRAADVKRAVEVLQSFEELKKDEDNSA